MKKIILSLCFLFITLLSFSQAQVSRNRLKQPIYSLISRQVPIPKYLDSLLNSMWNIHDDGVPTTVGNVWSLSGNTPISNTSFIGTTNNTSFNIKTNGNRIIKVDSVGVVSINTSTSTTAYPVVVKDWNLVPGWSALYLGVANPGSANYSMVKAADSTILAINATQALSFRVNQNSRLVIRNWLSVPSSSNQISFLFSAATLTSSTANTARPSFQSTADNRQWLDGITPNQYDHNFIGGTHSGVNSMTITNDYCAAFTAPIQGTNAVLSNKWAIRSIGNLDVNGSMLISNLAAGVAPTATLDVRGTAAFSSTMTTSGITNTGNITSTGNLSGYHYIGTKSIASSTLGTGAGTGATSTLTSCTDAAGTISITTAGTPAGSNATVITLTFGTAYGTTPHVVLSPKNAATAALGTTTQVFPGASTTVMTITGGSAGLTTATLYAWDYIIMQ